MKPRVTLRKALEDPELLGSALAGPTWHAWRSLLIAAMGEPLTKDELKTFTLSAGKKPPPLLGAQRDHLGRPSTCAATPKLRSRRCRTP